MYVLCDVSWYLRYFLSVLCFPATWHYRKPWWRHQMETFSALLAICAGDSPVIGEFPAQIPVTRSFDVSLICTWINGWVNNPEAGDLRRYRAHNEVSVLPFSLRDCSFQLTSLLPLDRAMYGPRWYIVNYNMTVWHFGPCVTFWPCLCDISARLVWHFGPLVRNEGKRVSPYPHINHWRRL